MLFLFLVMIITFLMLVNQFELAWILEWLINQPSLYYQSILVGLWTYRLLMWLEYPYYLLKRLIRKVIDWINSDEPRRGDSPTGSNSKVTQNKGSAQRRSYSTSSRSPINKLSKNGKNSAQSAQVSKVVEKASRGKTSLYHSTLLRLNFSLDNIQDWFTVKGGRPLVNILKGISIMAGANATSGTIRVIVLFIVHCKHLKRTQGVKGLTKFLKAATVSVQQSLGGHRVRDVGLLGARVARTQRGLPRFIPAQLRKRIRAGDPTAIRMILTLLNVYRIFKFPGTLKLQTITNPFMGKGPMGYILAYIPLFLKLFVWSKITPPHLLDKMNKWASDSVFQIFKGGPGVKGILGEWNTMPQVLIKSFLALRKDSGLWDSLTIFLSTFTYTKLNFLVRVVSSIESMKIQVGEQSKPLISPFPYLGKLGTKEEAAGKIRVFAMVDGWTQWVLYPIHKAIFFLLEKYKMDGTFDQTRPLSFVKAVRGLWSLDLSAATDRIPLTLQRALMSGIFGFELAGAWSNLLVGRVYRYHHKDGFTDLRYAVGQPMGALSSWASLAITHHFIIQVAAWRAGFPTWKLYDNYAVLGDDVVIGDYRVTTQYLLVLDSLGVECGLHKSLLSHKGLAMEFAKKTIVNGVDVSPVAWKEFYAASRNLGAFIELTTKFKVPFHKALQAFGVGWQVRSWLNKPIGKLSARIRLVILAFNIPKTQEAVIPFFEMGRAPVAQFAVETAEIVKAFISKEMKRLSDNVFAFSHAVGEAMGEADALGREFAEAHIESVCKGDVPPKTGYLRRSLSDVWTNIRRTFIFDAGPTLIEESGQLWKDINNVKPNTEFAQLYMKYLEFTDRKSLMSLHAFAITRPAEPEVKGLMTPSQVRLWKRWSQVLTGSAKIPDNTARNGS